MKVPRRSIARRLAELFTIVMMLAGPWLSHSATAQDEKAVEGYPTVLQRDISLWSDGTRYPVELNGIYKGKSDRARGIADPVPQGGGSPGGLKGTPYWERILLFAPGQHADRVKVPTLLIDAEKEHYFKIEENSGRVHGILKQNGIPTEYHVLKGKAHYDVYSGECLDDVMKLEIPWFDKHLKTED